MTCLLLALHYAKAHYCDGGHYYTPSTNDSTHLSLKSSPRALTSPHPPDVVGPGDIVEGAVLALEHLGVLSPTLATCMGQASPEEAALDGPETAEAVSDIRQRRAAHILLAANCLVTVL